MSYREKELEEAYDRLEDNYWQLVDWLKLHAPLTLNAFKHRDKAEVEQ